MPPRSLQTRMLLSSALATMVVTLLFGWAIAVVLERFVVEGLDGRLDAGLTLLASAVDGDGHVDRQRLDRDSGGIVSEPDWRWRIQGPDGAISSAGPVPQLPPLPSPPPGRSEMPPPDAGRPRPIDATGADGVAVHARVLVLQTGRGPVLLVTEAPRAVVSRPIRAALLPLLVLLAVLLLLLTAAALVQLRIGLAPVRRLRDEVEAIRSGRSERVDERQPAELLPLAVELNALAADNRAALQVARRSGANLAHALKTPIAVLALDLREDPARTAQLDRIDATIRHHLHRARIELADKRVETALAPALDGVLEAIRQLHRDRSLLITSEPADRLGVAMDRNDVDELLGNLLDNAATHASREVRVEVGIDPADGRRVRIAVADDGPGIPASQRDAVLQPGLRLDERRDGHGFGLAIVAELVSLHGGGIALGERPGGGLRVEVVLPGRTGAKV